MSLKENVKFIKDEISTQEKFFEGFFKLEKVWKKYKVVIVSSSIIAIALFIGIAINNYLTIQKNIKNNIAYDKLLEIPNDKNAIIVLKKSNPKLLAIANYVNNKNIVVNVEFLEQISKFNKAIQINNINNIDKIFLDSNFLLKEYALFQKSLSQTIDKKYENAKKTLALIPTNSAISQLSNQLKHYLLTK
jgi:hypothetical protein